MMKPKDLKDHSCSSAEPPKPAKPPEHYGDDHGMPGFDDDGEYGVGPGSGGGAFDGQLFESGTVFDPDEAAEDDQTAEEEAEDEHPEVQ